MHMQDSQKRRENSKEVVIPRDLYTILRKSLLATAESGEEIDKGGEVWGFWEGVFVRR